MDKSFSTFAIKLLIGLVALASARVWIGVVARLARGEAIVPHSPRRPAPWTIVDVLLIVMAYILLNGAIEGALTAWDHADVGDNPAKTLAAYETIRRLSASALANIVTVALSIGLLSLRTGATRDDLGFSGGQWIGDLRLGATAFVAVSVPIYALQFVLTRFFESRHPIMNILEIDHGPLTMAWVGLIAVVIAPVAEEFLFRVVIQGWLEAWEARRSGLATTMRPSGQALTYGTAESGFAPAAVTDAARPLESGNPYQPPGLSLSVSPPRPEVATGIGRGFGGAPVGVVPVVATSLLFALMHVGHGPDPIPLFLLALVLGFLYQRTHRVLPGIVLHVCLNGTSMLIFWLGGGK